jgi:hypothetical protein
MNFARISLAALAAFVAYFALGSVVFTRPQMVEQFRKFPAVYRNQEDLKKVMTAGMAAMLLSMFVLTLLYAMLYRGGSGLLEGARFGALIGVFAVCAFVIHNHVNLNIGLGLTISQAVAYFVEWTVCGIVIGLIYRPSVAIVH